MYFKSDPLRRVVALLGLLLLVILSGFFQFLTERPQAHTNSIIASYPQAPNPCAESHAPLAPRTVVVADAQYCVSANNILLAFTVEGNQSVVVESLREWKQASVRLLASWAGPKRECAEGGADTVRISFNLSLPQACAWVCGKWLACADGLYVLRGDQAVLYHQQKLDDHLARLSKAAGMMRGSP